MSVLRVAPFVEMLEVHFGGDLWFSEEGPGRHALCPFEYKYLKNMHITGYKAAKGQLEFVLHVVANAPALEVLTVQVTQKIYEDYKIDRVYFERAGQYAEYGIAPNLSPGVKFCVI